MEEEGEGGEGRKSSAKTGEGPVRPAVAAPKLSSEEWRKFGLGAKRKATQ